MQEERVVKKAPGLAAGLLVDVYDRHLSKGHMGAQHMWKKDDSKKKLYEWKLTVLRIYCFPKQLSKTEIKV